MIKAALACQGREESQEVRDPLEFTKGSPEELGIQEFLDTQALQARLDLEES